MVEKKKKEKKNEKAAPEKKKMPHPERALLFELEYFAVNSRRALYDILKSMFKDLKVDFTIPLYSRYCLLNPPEQVLADLPERLGAGKTDGKKFRVDAINGLNYFLNSGDFEPKEGLEQVIKYAAENNMAIMAVSALSGEQVEKILNELGFSQYGVRYYLYDSKDKTYPGADIWMKAAKEIEVQPRKCITLVSSMESCKSSLTAGMRSLVVPDEFTAFQDFGGANRVLDQLTDMSPKEIFEPLFPV